LIGNPAADLVWMDIGRQLDLRLGLCKPNGFGRLQLRSGRLDLL
jgi:hypothetical protein